MLLLKSRDVFGQMIGSVKFITDTVLGSTKIKIDLDIPNKLEIKYVHWSRWFQKSKKKICRLILWSCKKSKNKWWIWMFVLRILSVDTYNGSVQREEEDRMGPSNPFIEETTIKVHCYSFKIYFTRLLGRFAPIFYFNCEHVLIVNIEKQKTKRFREFYKKK